MFYIGIDNGVSGTVGVLGDGVCEFFKTPIIKDTHYAKSREKMTRMIGRNCDSGSNRSYPPSP